jgi:hypothetical protein
MMRASIENANKTLNQFPARNGVSDVLSPLTIMTGRPTPDYNDLKIEFGAYAQVFEDNDPTNTVKARTTGAIALTPAGNAQGGFHFLSLATGRKLSRQQWDELPMPDGVIAAAERMAQDKQQPLIGHRAPLFEWTPGVAIEEEVQMPITQDEHNHDDVIGAVEDKADEPMFGPQPDPKEQDQDDIDAPVDDEYLHDHRSENDSLSDEDVEGTAEDHEGADDDVLELDYGEQPDEDEESSLAEPDPKHTAHGDPEPEEQTGHNLRPNRTRSYSHRLGHIMDNPDSGESYDAQLLQLAESDPSPLREAIQEMQRTGDNHDVFKCLTGIVMT